MLGVVGLLVATTLVPSGCGDPDPDGPASESGQYAGRSGDLGGLVDFQPADATVSRLKQVMERRGIEGSVAVAALVNRSDHLIPIPTVTAHRLNGRSAVLARADRDPRFTAAAVRSAGTYVPAKGALTVYLVLPGTSRDVVEMGMRVGLGTEITLAPQRADGAQKKSPAR